MNQKAAKQRIAKDLVDCEDLVKTCLDPIVEIIRDEKPDVNAEYQNARKIKFPPRRTIALKVKVYQSGTLTPMPCVTLTITPDTNSDAMKASTDLVKNVKRSSPKSGSMVKNLADGKYLITAEKPGFETKNAIAYIISGQTCLVKFEMTALE